MIGLKEALALPPEEVAALRSDLIARAKERSDLNAYIDLATSGTGVPIAIKDNINVKGWEITCASAILQGYIAPYDATAIEKLRQAGLAPLGRTNMDEFAMGSSTETSHYGKTLNPHDPTRVPGGSSGGSAAAVAAGIAIAALGSDTGGSIRQPAAFCGIVGMKPTYGRVSRYGLIAYGSSLDQIGPMTRSVEDAAILYNIIAGHDPKDSTSAPIPHQPISPEPDRTLRIGVVPNYVAQTSQAIQKAYQEAIQALEGAGHTIVEVEMMDAKYKIAAYYITAMAEASTNLSRYDGVRYGKRVEASSLKEMYKATRSQFGKEVQRRILLGTFVLSSGYYDAYYIKAQKARNLIQQEYAKLFQQVDLILTPVAPDVAFPFGSKKEPLEMYLSDLFTIGVNLAGLPAISLPIQEYEGLPVGLQLIAKAFDEKTLFDGAASLEREVAYKGVGQ
ncbi:MAG: Asp-tRNA(Asn)/Glu-tRNA(Gln) amidotransferase GatCAB subunit A [Nitratiruptor sp.]|nr:Asp-tRNA(Asn)/Glu-tRNA(Gln) amidotransferase GatCAB subunit A [Nitratiruptor sp.]NPA84316.1 Asp-tRNA(Asn)/Glu-tRNA(Gln) amidotransferase subunit GatA [Campylobacterota bacterium]